MVKYAKRLLIVPVVLLALTVGWALQSGRATAEDPHTDIVGAWEVDADAPYRPHLFTFSADGNMFTTNPTNVQENPTANHGGTNDSVGMGQWKVVSENGTKYVVGTFEQLNAFADNHQPTDKLSVSFKVTVDGDSFDGPGVVHLGSFVVPTHISGTRINVDDAAVNTL